jgi:hypothetical protein
VALAKPKCTCDKDDCRTCRYRRAAKIAIDKKNANPDWEAELEVRLNAYYEKHKDPDYYSHLKAGPRAIDFRTTSPLYRRDRKGVKVHDE